MAAPHHIRRRQVTRFAAPAADPTDAVMLVHLLLRPEVSYYRFWSSTLIRSEDRVTTLNEECGE